MNKTKSKVLSLVLASAMIVSSFSSLNFASAASRTETGSVDGLKDKIYLASQSTEAGDIDLSNLIGNADVKTSDREDASGEKIVRISHVSGDKLLRFNDEKITIKKEAAGKEVINVRYEADYDRDDKDVTVRASKDITVYADVEGKYFLAKADDLKDATKRPGDIPTAAVNEAALKIGVYTATAGSYNAATYTKATDFDDYYASDALFADVPLFKFEVAEGGTAPVDGKTTSSSTIKKGDEVVASTGKDLYVSAKSGTGSAWTKVNGTTAITGLASVGQKLDSKLIELKSDKAFTKATVNADSIVLTTKYVAEAKDGNGKVTQKRELAKANSDTLKIKLGKVVNSALVADSNFTDTKVAVAKKWNADADASGADTDGSAAKWEINKVSGTTYLAPSSIDWDKKNWSSNKDQAESIGSYDEIVADGQITVKDGSVEKLTANDIIVEKGSTGDLDPKNSASVEDGSVGTIKNNDATGSITVENGKVKAIETKKAPITITGGTIAGDVWGDTVKIDADDDDVSTTIGGKVTAENEGDDKGITIDSSSDAKVTVKGTIKGLVALSGSNVTVGTVDANYLNDVSFKDFTGAVKELVNANKEVTLEGESVVSLGGKLTADSVDIDADSKLTVADANVGSISGEGTFAFTAGKLNVKDDVDTSTKLIIANGLKVGDTAFTSDEGTVDGSDLNTLGFTLETKSANSTTDKHVIKSVKFAGVQFDKTALTIAKGHSDTVTVANYPSGTALPAGYSVEWNVDVNDDYITVTTEGNTATVKAVDYSTDRAIDNEGTITASVVDKDGFVVEDLLEASIKVTAIEKPASVVTLDTTKPVTVGTGAVYQYIAKSSTGAVMTAASYDTQIATVELFNAADPRGYKFQVKGIAEGTATITTTDANGATATLTVNVVKVNGTLKADTTTYTFAPGAIYDVKFSTTGTTAVPVVTVNGKVVSIAPRGNGVYRVTAQNAGTAFVVAKVGNTHVSVKFVVAPGAVKSGVTGNNVSILK